MSDDLLEGIEHVEPMKLVLRDIKLLPVNPRFMTHEQFIQLVDNLRRDGHLTSTPFCWLDKKIDKYEVLSGNHRIKAAIEAGIDEAWCLVTHDQLSEDRRVAIQLSHNSIVGDDDPALLKQLYEKIEDVDLRLYAGLDDRMLELLEKVQPLSFNEAALEFQTVAMIFLPDELADVERAFDAARELTTGRVMLNRFAEYDAFLDALSTAGGAHGVTNTATALMVVLRIFERHQDELAEGYINDYGSRRSHVPLSAIFGVDRIPINQAVLLHKRIDRLMELGSIEERWKALELWATEGDGDVPG